MRDQGTLLDAVGRTKHTLIGARESEQAGATVHGECPIAGCRAMNVIHVQASTTRVTCSSCGAVFDV